MSKLREIEDAMLRHRDPVVSVPELADELDRSTTHIRDQLRLLEREGVVTSKDVGARAVAWWHVRRVAEPQETNEAPPSDAAVRESTERPPSADEPHSADSSEALVQCDFPEGRPREECVEAVLAAHEYLRDKGPATMREIVTDVGAEHPIGYDVPEEIEGRYRGAWWRHVVKPGLEAMSDVEKPTGGASEWRVEQ